MVGTSVNRLNSKFVEEKQEMNDQLVQNNEQLEKLIGEKEVLLKEIHHRVKNNLQVITSLLSLQSSFIKDSSSKALFRYSQYRINSMAMIHEMLYQSDNISEIDYSKYADKLINNLVVSMKGSENNIDINIDVKDVFINIDTAIPLGLMINEITTNAFKYGIPDQKKGSFHLKMSRIGPINYKMEIGDDGPGFSEDINFRSSSSLGLMLIHKLAIQLNGNIEKNNSKPGTHYILNFTTIEGTH